MTFKDEIVDMQARLAKAQSERDAWQSSGMQEKYLEAYSRFEALELGLERLRQEGLRTSARDRERVGALLASPPLSGHADRAAPGEPGERERLMAELAIAYNGRQYQYGPYRYDHLGDAVSYARRQPLTPCSDASEPLPSAMAVEAPDESQHRLMASLAITFEDGVYRLRSYRYDRLADAVRYARLRPIEEDQP